MGLHLVHIPLRCNVSQIYLTGTGLKVTSALYKMYYVGWCDAETVSTPASDHIP